MGTNENDLATRIDTLRVARGISVLELSNESTIPLTTLQRRLAGDGKLTIGELKKLSTVLDVPVSSWFEVAA